MNRICCRWNRVHYFSLPCDAVGLQNVPEQDGVEAVAHEAGGAAAQQGSQQVAHDAADVEERQHVQARATATSNTANKH